MSNKKLITLTKFKKLEKIKNLQNSKTQNFKLSFMNKIGYLQHSKNGYYFIWQPGIFSESKRARQKQICFESISHYGFKLN